MSFDPSTKKERIAQLERRVADLEQRLWTIEMRPAIGPYYPLPYQPVWTGPIYVGDRPGVDITPHTTYGTFMRNEVVS